MRSRLLVYWFFGKMIVLGWIDGMRSLSDIRVGDKTDPLHFVTPTLSAIANKAVFPSAIITFPEHSVSSLASSLMYSCPGGWMIVPLRGLNSM